MEITVNVMIGRVAREVLLPISEEELLYRFGLEEGSEPVFRIEESWIKFLNREYPFEDLSRLNEFAESVSDVDEDTFEQILEVEDDMSLSDWIDYSFVDVRLYEADTDLKLGEALVEEVGFSGLSRETLECYFDYRKYGQDVRIESRGNYSSKGNFVMLP